MVKILNSVVKYRSFQVQIMLYPSFGSKSPNHDLIIALPQKIFSVISWQNSKSLRNKFEKIERNSIFSPIHIKMIIKSAIFPSFSCQNSSKFNQILCYPLGWNSLIFTQFLSKIAHFSLIFTEFLSKIAQNWLKSTIIGLNSPKIAYFHLKFK